MNPIFASALGASLLTGTISFHISNVNLEGLSSMTKWFLNRAGFELPLVLITLFTGLIFTVAGHRGSLVANFLDKVGDFVMNFYSSASGSVFGWVAGVCVAASLQDFDKYFRPSLTVTIMILAIVFLPLQTFSSARSTIKKYNEGLFRDNKKQKPLQISGILIVIASIVELLDYCVRFRLINLHLT